MTITSLDNDLFNNPKHSYLFYIFYTKKKQLKNCLKSGKQIQQQNRKKRKLINISMKAT